MKMMKLALIGTAAVAAVSVSARADELSDLKAQIEALNSRMATLETQPAVPAGYQLMSISKGTQSAVGVDWEDVGAPATVISVMPTADAPASSEIVISGEVRAAIRWRDSVRGDELLTTTVLEGDDDIDVVSRGSVTISGKTDTAVGEVGGKFAMVQSVDVVTGGVGSVSADGYWGYWKFADGMELGGGRDGSLAGLDGSNSCTCYYAGNDVGFGRGDPSQIRLKYASGPIAFAIALEDASVSDASDDALGVAAEAKFSMDMISFEIAGGAWDDDDYVQDVSPDAIGWQVGAGIGLSVDIFSLKAAAAIGETWSGSEYVKASALASFSVADGISAELGAGIIDVKDAGDVFNGLAAIYYSPVDKLKFGLEAGISDAKGAPSSVSAAFVTIYKF